MIRRIYRITSAILVAALSFVSGDSFAEDPGPPGPTPACDGMAVRHRGKCSQGLQITECKPKLVDGQPTCPSSPTVSWVILFDDKQVCEQVVEEPNSNGTACFQSTDICMRQVLCRGPVEYIEKDGEIVSKCPKSDYNGASTITGTRATETSDCDSGAGGGGPVD